jgi:hypothetical protein
MNTTGPVVVSRVLAAKLDGLPVPSVLRPKGEEGRR